MKRVVTVFIDGLRPDSLRHMPFLQSLSTHRIRTELGYSIACHSSMYSGVHPNKHLNWFIWKYSPSTSPFAWMRNTGMDNVFDNSLSRYISYRTTRFLTPNSSFFGLPFLVHTPLILWPYFDVTEKKLWDEMGYLETYPTIFDILRQRGIPFQVVGMNKKLASESSKLVNVHRTENLESWIYYFIGDVDPISHRYGQDSPVVREVLKDIDKIIERKYRMIEKELGEFIFFCFSDHGHIPVKDEIDIHKHFKSNGLPLKKLIHIIDSNFARFWFRNERERMLVERILCELENGKTLDLDLQKKYNVDMQDNRYGDLIFYLDKTYIFQKGKMSALGRIIRSKDVSAHGYLPDYDESDGFFATNCTIHPKKRIELVDIAPSILAAVDISPPVWVDGTSLF